MNLFSIEQLAQATRRKDDAPLILQWLQQHYPALAPNDTTTPCITPQWFTEAQAILNYEPPPGTPSLY